MKDFMKEAIKEAKKAFDKGEVPIGALVVQNGQIISRGHNTREQSQNAIKHAEIIAIEKACKKLKSWRLEDCEIYVTLEPCPMCAGAIANARITKLHYGCQEKTSCDHLCESILSSERLNHKTEIIFEEEREEEISTLLSDFFKAKRKKKDQD
ncbi:MAG: nucleoside deaminase [Clostridia bacterium]|nr:nucleoside deaminase [Clostridia bacterium]